MSNNHTYQYNPNKPGQLSLQFAEEVTSEMRLPAQKTTNTIPWVEFGTMFGWINQQPQYYDYIKKSSPKNSAILGAKKRYVYGKGFKPDFHGLNPTQKLKLQAFVSKVNRSKAIRKNVGDRNEHNMFAVEVIFSLNGKTIYPAYLPVKNIRVSKDEFEADGKTLKPKVFYYTKDWSKGKKAMSNPDFTEFHPWDWGVTKRNKSNRYIIFYKGDGYEDDAYALPDYVGGVPYIDADCEVSNYVKNTAKNSFMAGYLVNFFDGEPDVDLKKQIVERFDAAFHGTDKAGKSIKSFNPEGGKGVEISPLVDNGHADRFNALNEVIRDEIFTAHTTSPLVVGMKGDNGFNNNADEKRVAIEAFTEDFVLPNQEPFNDLINSFLEFNQIAGSASLQRLDPIKPQVSEATLKETLSDSEFREYFGLPKSETTVVNPVLDALRSLSPLVQNKILDELSSTEIRGLIELKTDPLTGTVKTKETITREFSDEDAKVIAAFAEFGFEDAGSKLLDRRELYAVDTFDAARLAKTFAFDFANSTENSILKLLAGDPELATDEIAQALKVKESVVNDAIEALQEQGLLEGMQITPEGQEKIGDDEIVVVYKYELRDDAPALVKGGKTRKFCEEMVKLSKTRSWTFEDIQNISNRLGYDVFARRGGWYHNPKTDKNTPYCRHMFSQRLVRRAA